MTFYNAASPINIADTYGEWQVVEFLIKMPTGRQMKAGSLRLNGKLQVKKTLAGGTPQPILGNEGVMLNQYCGVHSFFRNSNTTINNRTIESLQNYPRYVAMMAQHDATPEGVLTSSAHASELKGCLNTYLLAGNTTKGISFSMKPHVCLNKTSAPLPQSKFQEMKVMFQLGSGLESLYIVDPGTDIQALSFEFSDLQLSWMEQPEEKGLSAIPTIFNCISNMVQTITGLNSNIQVVSSTAYDALSMSFIRQNQQRSLNKDALLCEYVPDINRVEFLVNGGDAPLAYALQPPLYQDVALNYYNSLSSSGAVIWKTTTGRTNSIMNRFLSENGCFGVGMRFSSSINDKLQVALTIDDNTDYNPSDAPIDCFIYVNSFLSL